MTNKYFLREKILLNAVMLLALIPDVGILNGQMY